MKKILFYFSAIWLIVVPPVFAADTTNANKVTDPITMTDTDDNYINAATGNITISGAPYFGIYTSRGSDRLENAGIIDINNPTSYGIGLGEHNSSSFTAVDNDILINSGTIIMNVGDRSDDDQDAIDLGAYSENDFTGSDNDSFTNTGTITITHSDDDAIDLGGYTNGSFNGSDDDYFNNSGTITIIDAQDNGIDLAAPSDALSDLNIFINTGTIDIQYSSGAGIDLSNDDDTFTNSGDINITSEDKGIDFGDGVNRFVNETSGIITIVNSDDYAGIDLGDDGDFFTNSGAINITSEDYQGIDFEDGENIFINNATGIINISSDWESINFGDGDDTFTNSGDINITSEDKGIDFGDGVNRFVNETGGIITIVNSDDYAGIDLGDDGDFFTNSGAINITSEDYTGIDFQEGINTFVNNAGGNIDINSYYEGIYFGDEEDAFTNFGDINITSEDQGIDFGDGANRFVNETGGIITIVNSGEYSGIYFGDGDDTFTNSGAINITTNDYTGIDFQEGINTFINNAGGNIDINSYYEGIYFGDEEDTFTNFGDINITAEDIGIDLGDGANRFVNETGGIITIVNSDDYAGIDLGDDGDFFTNSGAINITSEDYQGIDFEDGENIFINNAAGIIDINSFLEGILFGIGDDSFTNEGSITIASASNNGINMGAGNDAFTTSGAIDTTDKLIGGDGTDTLNFAGTNNLSFVGDIETFETINKNGSGFWNLQGVITGATAININDGILYLNGTVPGDVMAAGSGGLGVTSPDSIGTLALTGSLDFGSGALLIDINSGAADLVTVAGAADLDGGALIVNPLDNRLDVSTPRQILTAGTLTGNFATVNSTSPLFKFEANYAKAANEVWLGAERVSILEARSQVAAPLTKNQRAIGGYIDKAIAAGATGPIITALISLSAPEAINDAINTFSPEPMASAIGASQNNVSIQNLNISARLGVHHKFAGLQMSKFAAGLFSDYYPILNANKTESESPNAFWAKALYLNAESDSDDGTFKFNVNTTGLTIGKDYLLGNFMVGFAGGYSQSDIKFDTVPTDGDADTLNVSLYGSYVAPKYYIDAILSYSNHDYSMDRYVPILNETANGDYRADEYGLYVNYSYPIKLGNNLTITPLASLQYSHYEQNAYTETGSSTALAVSATDSDSFVSGVGVLMEKTLDYGEWKIMPKIKLIWKHEYCDATDKMETRFAEFDEGLGSFAVEGYERGAAAYSLGLGATVYKGKDMALFLDYDLGIKDNFTAHSVTAGVKFYF